jgi:anti-sigma factor RsiW
VKREAQGKLRAFFETSLDDASRAEQPIGFDEVAAYVDGRLPDVDREIFESRLAHDPVLQAEVADLAAMRDAMPAPRAGSQATATAAATPRGRAAGKTSMIWMLGRPHRRRDLVCDDHAAAIAGADRPPCRAARSPCAAPVPDTVVSPARRAARHRR